MSMDSRGPNGLKGAIGLNFYETDLPLVEQVRRRVDPDVKKWAEARLSGWGELCGGPIARRAEVIDKNPPRLERYDRWGYEVNRVVHHPDGIATKRDLCEAAYTGFRSLDEVKNDPKRIRMAPILGTAFSYMLNQSDTGMGCACGMTRGVAEIVERFGSDDVKERFMPVLTTTDFDELWDGSMFMTERSGGSDLSGSETIAIKDGQHWLLEGDKWFCSNVDGRVILTLARPEGAGSGTKGLGLFLVPATLEDGSPNSIHIRRIKDKLGTRSVPTGEVTYGRAVAHQIGESGIGINRMMEMVNISRLGVALMGIGIARRTLVEAAIYASEREAFGRRIIDYPMVRETLLDMAVEAEAALLLSMEASSTAIELDDEGGDEKRTFLRILTPLAKIRGARIGLDNAVQAVEILGGNGYIEDWPTARQLRDAQCHTIWEGTENINSLDVLRSVVKASAHEALFARVDRALESADEEQAALVSAAKAEAEGAVGGVLSAPDVHAKRFAGHLCNVLSAALLLEQAGKYGSERDGLVASRFVERRLRLPSLLPDVSRWLSDDAFHKVLALDL